MQNLIDNIRQLNDSKNNLECNKLAIEFRIQQTSDLIEEAFKILIEKARLLSNRTVKIGLSSAAETYLRFSMSVEDVELLRTTFPKDVFIIKVGYEKYTVYFNAGRFITIIFHNSFGTNYIGQFILDNHLEVEEYMDSLTQSHVGVVMYQSLKKYLQEHNEQKQLFMENNNGN